MASSPSDKGRASPALIDIDGVDKRFDNGTTAVRDMTLRVRPGEFVSLLGPSGCGKSTVLKMIAGLLLPSAGTITVNGSPARKARGVDQLGYVFQDATLMPWATVADNVFLPLRLSGESRGDAMRKVMESLEMVGLTSFKDAYPRELSGGMKMRVSIARAMVTRPPLLLMDEPFAALDEMTRFKLNNDVLDLWERLSLTVIFVTHSVFESVNLSSRVVVMAASPGRVVDEIDLSANYPRTEDYRTTPEYAENCRLASKSLQRSLAYVDASS